MDIKNLLFDLGGVIMNIRRENAVEALTELGMKGADKLLGDYVQSGLFLRLEEGKITPEEFHRELKKKFPENLRSKITDAQLDDAFLKFLIGIPVRRLQALEKLHRKYSTFMLSNTNIIMWDGEILRAFKEDGHDLNYYFDGIVTSFNAHCVKPDAEIFRYTISNLNINPEETLFLDDSVKNLEAAAAFGFNILHVPTDTEFEDLLPGVLKN